MRTSRPERILLIEDDLVVGERLRRDLESGGHRVLWSVSGEEGLRLAGEGQADVVILDLRLPAMDGLTVRDNLLATEQTKDLPVVTFSNFDTPESSSRTMDALRSLLHSRARWAAERRAGEELVEALATVIELEPQILERASAKESDLTDSERAALDEGGLSMVPPPGELDPQARFVAEFAATLRGALTVQEAATRLGIDEGRVRQRLGARTLYGIKGPHGWRLPAFQFNDDGGEVPGLSQVLRALDVDLHPVEVRAWLEEPDAELEIDGRPVSPVNWLRSGGSIERAAEIASRIGTAEV